MKSTVGAALMALSLAACGEAQEEAKAPAGPPPPPSPDLPLDTAKVNQIMGASPLSCMQLASMKLAMVLCAERQNQPADHEALRTQLRDLRWNTQGLPADQAAAQCQTQLDELGKTPKPAACWDL